MRIGTIEGATRFLGAPKDWDQTGALPCEVLPVRDVHVGPHGNFMISYWHPTEEEISRINAGLPVRLWVRGTVHPPVTLDVESAKESNDG